MMSLSVRTRLPWIVLSLLALALSMPASGMATPVTGKVIAWGWNGYGQSSVPAEAQSGVSAIAGGGAHSLAVKDGKVIAWGRGDVGQATVPTDAQSGVSAVAAGAYHSLALKEGKVIAWGWNGSGQAIVPTDAQSGVSAMAGGGYHSLALKDGKVIGWGNNDYGQATAPGEAPSGVSAIAAGTWHNLALKDGKVIGWGRNLEGQAIVPTDAQSGVSAIAAGDSHSLALKDGRVVAWGGNGSGQTTVPTEAQSGVTAIAAGGSSSYALKDGKVIAWGYNGYNQIAVPTEAQSGVLVLAAGGNHALAIDTPDTTPPTITITSPADLAVVPVGTSTTFSAQDTESGLATGSPAGSLNDGTTTKSVSSGYQPPAGVYTLTVTASDQAGNTAPNQTIRFTVYDPAGGFVTGAGFIESPSGAYTPQDPNDPDLVGRAFFGFVSRYEKGATVPTGRTAFEFKVANLDFRGTSFQWLVVNKADSNAQFKGAGTINGQKDQNGQDYRFQIWATSASPDKFRIKIWWEDGAGEHVVYDNGTQQAIGGGNILVQAS